MPLPDHECIRFLQWALPRMGFRWPGFRRVRRQVRRRLKRRLTELGLGEVGQYRTYLREHPEEWRRLDGLCRITISRFFRDRKIFERLGAQVLPRLTQEVIEQGEPRLKIWCAGCGAGEEPYSIVILWRHGGWSGLREVSLKIVGTDAEAHQLERAGAAEYRTSSLREIPEEWRRAAFDQLGEDRYRLHADYREGVVFLGQDLRRKSPPGNFDLILCRNLAFTYFAEAEQRRVLGRLLDRLRPAGALVIGSHERLPFADDLRLVEEERCTFRLAT